MRKKEIERIPFGDQKVHIHKDTLLVDGVTLQEKNVRICIRKKEFANYVEGDGWNQRLLDGSYYCYTTAFEAKGLEEIEEQQKMIAMNFLDEMLKNSFVYWARESKLGYKLRAAQENINEIKRQVKEKNRQKKIKDHIRAVKKPSEKLKTWASNQMTSYFFYRTVRKKSSGVCPACQKTITFDRTMEKIQHNQSGKCPCCGKEIIFKAAGRQKRIEEKLKTVRFSKTKYGLTAIESVTVKRSREGGEVLSDTKDLYIKFLQEGFELYDDYQGEGTPYWSDSGRYGMGSYPHGKALIYKGGLKQSIQGTPFEHSGIDVVATWDYDKEPWMDILQVYNKNPDIEKLIKAGMKRLTRELTSWDQFLRKGTKLHEILGITRADMRMARDHDFSKSEVRVLRNDSQGKLSASEVKALAKAANYLYELKQYTTIRKITTYLTKGHDPAIWADYLRMAADLHYDMQSKAVLFPRDLNNQHDKVAEETKVLQTIGKEQQYEKRKPELGKYQYKTSKYIIKIPDSLQEIIEEGQSLHHCVGTYIDSVAKGWTTILFIREVGKEDISFYTMEVKGTEVIQYRGAYNNRHNNPVPESVHKFVQGFEKSLMKKERKAA